MKIDGKEFAREILEDLQKRVEKYKEKNLTPNLAIILVGDDSASAAYVRQKELKAQRIGVQTITYNLEPRIQNPELLSIIKKLNSNQNIHGIIVQRPLPNHIDEQRISLAVDPRKDIDSFHPRSPYEMPLAAAIMNILEHIFNSYFKRSIKKHQNYLNWLKQQHIVVLGKGQTGGGPTILLLKKIGIDPVVVDSKTQKPEDIIKLGDIVICAVGKPHLITGNMLKKGAIVLGIGMYRGENGKLHGDYEEDDVKNVASYYSPIPGGVGPVNVAMLLSNLLEAVKNQTKEI